MGNSKPNYEVGLWSYDATTQELYPPDSTDPISEVDARKMEGTVQTSNFQG